MEAQIVSRLFLHEESTKFYAEPCKSTNLAALQPLLALRDEGDAATIQQLIGQIMSGQIAA